MKRMNRTKLMGCAVVMLTSGVALASITTTGVVSPDIGTWTSAINGYIGNSGDGTVSMDGGSAVEANWLFVGTGAGDNGDLTLTGSGTGMTAFGRSYFGSDGDGDVIVNNGAVYEGKDQVTLGRNATGSGTLTVDGSGSLVSASAYWFLVGSAGSGVMHVSNGGRVEARNGIASYISFSTGATGWVDVEGAGSVWDASGDFWVGRNGSGNLRIQEGGLVVVDGALTIGQATASETGHVYLRTGGQLALADAAGTGVDSVADFLALVANEDDDLMFLHDDTGWTALADGTEGDGFTLTAGTGDLAGYTVLTAIPEPAVIGLVGFATVGLLFVRKFLGME